MRWARFFLQVVVMAQAVLHATAHAQALDRCTTGTPAQIVFGSGRHETRSEAPNSAVDIHYFTVLDALGNPLKDVVVEFETPESPVSGRFGSNGGNGFVASATPRRASASTTSACLGAPPLLVNGPLTGRYVIAARVVTSPSVMRSIPVDVVVPAALTVRQYVWDPPVLQPGSVVTSDTEVRWMGWEGSQRPYGGVPITFSIESGDARFVGGATTMTVTSDIFGNASVRAVMGTRPGGVEIRASVLGEQSSATRAIAGPAAIDLSWGVAREGRHYAASPFTYGEAAQLEMTALFPWLPCSVIPSDADLAGTFRVWLDGVELPSVKGNVSRYECQSFGMRTWGSVALNELGLGAHEAMAEFSGNEKVAGSPRSQVLRFTVGPQIETPLAEGGTLKLAVREPLYPNWQSCSVIARTGTWGAPSWPAQPPPGTLASSALFSVEAFDCTWVNPCSICEPTPRPALARRVLAARDPPLPAGTVAWAYGPTSDNASPHWYELPTSFADGQAYFLVVDAGFGDDSLTADYRIHATIALTVPAPGRYQDLWWAGLEENGWGLSLTQHRDVLFGELFIYDAEGRARWLAMPSGQWNAARTAYTGSLYRPRGTPYTQAYDASRFVIGPAVGTMTLTPSSPDAMRLDYTIDGTSGSKEINRLPFGPKSTSPQYALDDLWWGGVAQNGWGVVVAQQYRNFFTLWYTYDEQGDATWFVAPSSSQTDVLPGYLSPFRFVASLYRPRGSQWIGAQYDPTRHSLQKVGNVELYLGPYGGDMTLRMDGVSRVMGLSRLPF